MPTWLSLQRAGRCLSWSGGALVLNLAVCASSENFREFRDVAGPGVQGGIKTVLGGGEEGLADGLGGILDGLIDGLFAVVAPDGA